MLAGILLDVFVTRLLLPRGRICSSSSREAEEEQETYSFFTLVLYVDGERGRRVVGEREGKPRNEV